MKITRVAVLGVAVVAGVVAAVLAFNIANRPPAPEVVAVPATTTDVKQVRSIRVTLRGLSDQAVVSGTGTTNAVVGDSIVTQVVLRNALR